MVIFPVQPNLFTHNFIEFIYIPVVVGVQSFFWDRKVVRQPQRIEWGSPRRSQQQEMEIYPGLLTQSWRLHLAQLGIFHARGGFDEQNNANSDDTTGELVHESGTWP